MTSKIKVDNIENQCGGAVVTKCGGTTTITGSVVKANNIQASDAGNIISQSGTTITLGASGDTINLASGASQSGFGRTGTVDWQTTPKTATFTAANGEGYFINQGSAITANLPAGSAGAIVAFSDYARNFATYTFTISPNGSEKIGGVAADLSLSVNGQAITLVYVDATKGWINIQNAEDTETGVVPAYISATGGTITTVCTNFKVHTFTGPGTFCVSAGAGALAKAEYLVIAGGGGGGGGEGTGGGGAGGYRESSGATGGCYARSPLGACVSALSLSPGAFPIIVGGGGAGSPDTNPQKATQGLTSSFSTIASAGGGAGGAGGGAPVPDGTGGNGGSGGAGGGRENMQGGSGNTPAVSPAQGKDGGPATPATSPSNDSGGGGGGATALGTAGTSNGPGGNGGAGATSSINATPTARAGGGAGGAQSGSPGSAGSGGGAGSSGSSGDANKGGGGAGVSGSSGTGGSGGSGIVIIRYRFQA